MTVQRAGDLPGVAEFQLDDLASGVAVAGQADLVDRGRAGWYRRGRRRGQRDCDAAAQRGHAGCHERPTGWIFAWWSPPLP